MWCNRVLCRNPGPCLYFITGSGEKFDGVAVNNEAYKDVKCDSDVTRAAFLDKLDVIRTEAAKQQSGTLLTHFSLGWHWGTCSGAQSSFTWNAKSADATEHMIDIFDSLDVQVTILINLSIGTNT